MSAVTIEALEEQIEALKEQHEQTRARLRELENRERNYLWKGMMMVGAAAVGLGSIAWSTITGKVPPPPM